MIEGADKVTVEEDMLEFAEVGGEVVLKQIMCQEAVNAPQVFYTSQLNKFIFDTCSTKLTNNSKKVFKTQAQEFSHSETTWLRACQTRWQ